MDKISANRRNHSFVVKALIYLLAFVFLAPGLSVDALAAVPLDEKPKLVLAIPPIPPEPLSPASTKPIITYGEPPPRVIYTPKGFDEEAYSKLSCPQKGYVTQPLLVYLDKKWDGLQYGFGMCDTSKHKDILTHYDMVDTMREYNKKYGVIISFKYRGEKQYQKDKAFIKKAISEYQGTPCRVLLIPTRYSYDDLMNIKSRLDWLLLDYGSSASYEHRSGTLRYSAKWSGEEFVPIPEIEEYIQKNGYAPEVHVGRTGKPNPDTYDVAKDWEYRAEYEKNCGPWEEVMNLDIAT